MQTCMDKTDGPKIHVSGFSGEWGNGVITYECEGNEPPFPICITELVEWHEAYEKFENGTGVEPDLPKTCDVWMYPGKGTSKHGWWTSTHFWMQVMITCFLRDLTCLLDHG